MNKSIEEKNRSCCTPGKRIKKSECGLSSPIFQAIIKWLFQTVLLSLIPLLIYYLLHWAFQIPSNPRCRYISELCSFTLVIASSTLLELPNAISKSPWIKEIFLPGYIFLLLVFLVFYGIIYYCVELDVYLSISTTNKLFLLVKTLCGINFVAAFLVQIIGGYDGKQPS